MSPIDTDSKIQHLNAAPLRVGDNFEAMDPLDWFACRDHTSRSRRPGLPAVVPIVEARLEPCKKALRGGRPS